MPPRKKTRGILKRSSSDSADEDNINPKRPRPDGAGAGDVTSHISLDIAAAPRARKPITYKSKARQKAGLGVASPPKLTNFGFNVENKPKLGRALFHLSPSPRAKAKRSKVFASPKESRRRSKGGTNTSAETSRMEIAVDDDEDQQEEPVPESTSSVGTSDEDDNEGDDQPAPLPVLPAARPIEGPGLEIRTPLTGRVVPTLQSLSKRPRTTPIPLFAATPRQPTSHLPLVVDDDNNPPTSPTKPNSVPIFAPTPSHAPPVPSTPAHKPRSVPIFTPSLNRTQEDSPTKKPLPIFAPIKNPFASVTTPAHPNTLPTAPPKLPALSSTLPATDIPETPTTKGRSLPAFTPKLLFPPPIVEEEPQKQTPVPKVSKPPVFGGVPEDDEESTPRTSRQVEQPTQKPEPQVEEMETKQVEDTTPKQAEGTETKETEEEGPADVSMADLFNNSTVELTPRSERVLVGGQGFAQPAEELDCIPSSQPSERLENSHPVEPVKISQPEAKPSPFFGTRMTRSRSRSESASGSATQGGSVVPSRAGSVVLERAGSQAPQAKAESQVPSTIPENAPTVPESDKDSAAPKSRESSVSPKKRSRSRSVLVEIPIPATTTPRSASLSLTPLVTDQQTLSALKSQAQSRTNSMDEYRTSQTAALMVDTPREGDGPSAFPEPDPMDPETSPLSSLPDDMNFSFTNNGDTTAGDTTMRDAGDTTVCPNDMDTTMQPRHSAAAPVSPPISPPAPTSPVSSLPASPSKRPLPSSSPTHPEENGVPRDVMIPISDVVPTSRFPGSRSRSSSLTSLSELTDLPDDEDKPMEIEEVAPTPVTSTEPKKSMIPVVKRPGTPGPPTRPPTPGKTETPFGNRIGTGAANGMTPGPSRNGVGMGLASAKKSGIPTPGPAKHGALASSSKLAGSSASTSTATLGLGKPTATPRSTLATRTRSGVTKARSLAAPTASTAAKARTKVVTAPPPPRSRITSFMKPNPAANRPPPSSSSAIVPPTAPAGTNPSPRKGQSKDDSDLPGPRRSMISQDTQASLSSLSSALEKLSRPSIGGSRPGLQPRPGTSMGFTPPQRSGSSLGFSEKRTDGGGLRSSTGPGACQPMVKAATAKGKAKAKDEGGDDAEYEEFNKSGNKVKDNPNAPLRSCVIFVDVRTAEGEDSGSLFVDMLRELGAKIVSRPTPSTTHIVFKSGHQSTLTKYKLYDEPRPFLVGIAWVVQCVEKRERVDEEGFRVKTDEVSALDLKRRRKAELPHQMQFMARDPNPSGPKFGSMSSEASAVSKTLEASAAEVMQDAELAAERGKQRLQQKLFPRVRDRSPS